jgi:NAD(P)-dependent dehydrogenase (short-subunit alcohol dehydrogenase family)
VTLLDGKVAIVTGGGGGIGGAIVERFVAEGAAVVFAEIDGDRARTTQVAVGEGCVGVVCDVRDADTAAALVVAATDASTCSSTTSGTSAAPARRSTSSRIRNGTTSTA